MTAARRPRIAPPFAWTALLAALSVPSSAFAEGGSPDPAAPAAGADKPADGAPTAPVPPREDELPPKIKERRPLPAEPKKAIETDMEAALRSWYENRAGSTAKQLQALTAAEAAMDKALAEWDKQSKDRGLRHGAWWRDRLVATLPDKNPAKRDVFQDRVKPWEDSNAEFTVYVNVPKTYSPKAAPYPLIVSAVDAVARPETVLRQHYGPLLETHVVVAFVTDPKAKQEDATLSRSPLLLLRGYAYACDSYRIDRDRVVLDGIGTTGSQTVEKLGALFAPNFHGVVLRSPTTISRVVDNFAMVPVLALTAPDPLGPAALSLQAIKKANPGATVVEGADAAAGFASQAEAVQKWIGGLKPRAAAAPGVPFVWHMNTKGDVVNLGGTVLTTQFVEAASDIQARVMVTYLPEHNTIDVDCSNVATLVFYLNDDFLDLDQPLAVRVNGILIKSRPLERSLGMMREFTAGSPTLRVTFAPAFLKVDVPKEAQVSLLDRKKAYEQEKKAYDEAHGKKEDEGEAEGEGEDEAAEAEAPPAPKAPEKVEPPPVKAPEAPPAPKEPEKPAADARPAAPDFEAIAGDGRKVTLQSLTKDGEVLLYFIKPDCPINQRAVPHFRLMGEAGKAKGRLVGIFGGNAKVHEAWAKANSPTFPLLLDPDLKITKAYGVEKSPWVISVSKDARISGKWKGYSGSILQELAARLAAAGGETAYALEFKGAPEKETAG